MPNIEKLSIDYIIPSIAGRLGNNLFMIANAYNKAINYNKQLVVCKSQVHQIDNYFDNIFRDIDYIETFEDNKNYNPDIPSNDKHSIYVGYFQSENHFKNNADKIKSIFNPPESFIEKIKSEIPIIFEKSICSINVRKGDYLSYPNYHPTVSKEYIQYCIDKTKQSEYYLIVSDDIPWCKENIKIDNCLFLEGYKTYEQLWIMSLCKNFIISNSSFSWWGAYLSKEKNKKVLAPQTWFGPEGPSSWEDMYCEGWDIIPTYFDNGLIYPL